MQTKNSALILSLIMILLSIGVPKSLLAATVTVNVPKDFSTIQAAIDNAASLASANTGTTYSVLVEPGTYPGGIVLKSGISVAGRETARTIISGGGTGVAVTANSITGIVTFSNFTITTATVGIQVTGNSALKITNNVFTVGTGGTAVQIQGSPNVVVINNTFYQNGTAVMRDSDTTEIINNIFSNNTTNISQSGSLSQSGIDFNCFNPPPSAAEPIGTNSIPNALVANPDPLFVAPSLAKGDFHLQQGSPCIDAGTNINGPDSFNGSISDIGAYGGPGSDTIPFPVGIQSATAAPASSIAISWTSNNSYLVTNTVMPGGYNIYYSLNVSGAPYQTRSSTVSTITSTVISGLTSTTAAPPAPVLSPPSPTNASLMLSWSSVSGATGYNVHYGIASTSEKTINVGNVTSFSLSGLTNGQPYKVSVSAITQSIYFIAITAVDNTGSASLPGVAHESLYSQEASVPLGPVMESGLSNEVS
ncbi:MAG: right-handed parallel beta-helix repeat-containing protein, partial [Nitrospirota bacterium]